MPIFYQALATKQAKVSPNAQKNNKSLQIDIYSQAKDAEEDKYNHQHHKHLKCCLTLYTFSIVITMLGLFFLFYDNLRDNVLDSIRKVV